MNDIENSNVVDIKTAIKLQITAPSDVSGELLFKEGKAVYVPLFSSTVHAGFESPASDHVEEWVNPTDYLVDKQHNTRLFRVKGDCVDKAKIFENDIVIVNTAMEIMRGHVIVAESTDGFIIRVLGQHCLMPHSNNPLHQVIKFQDMQDIRAVGIVTGLMKRIPKFRL